MARAVLSRRARQELLGLEWPVADAVVEALRGLEREPHAGHALRGRLTGVRSLRVGSFRILYTLTDGDRVVRVLTVRHRADAYGADPR